MKTLTCATMIVALLASTSAMAQRDDRGDRHGNGNGHAWGQRGQQQGRPGNGQYNGWGRDRGMSHRWNRGERMGYNDWNGAQRVDYRRYNLRQPPRGYEWRRQNNQYILVAVATGLIASIILNAGR